MIGIDVGHYCTKVISSEKLWEQLAQEQQYSFLSKITQQASRVVVGDEVLSVLEQSQQATVFENFLSEILVDNPYAYLCDQYVHGFDLAELLFKKAQYYEDQNLPVILSVASYLTGEEKFALALAAKRAQWQPKAVVASHLAKAIALMQKYRLEPESIFAVYDWGDRHFEVAIYKVGVQQKLELLASDYTLDVSGQKVNHKVWEIIARKYRQQRGRDLTESILAVQDSKVHQSKLNADRYGRSSIEVRDYTIDLEQHELDDALSDLIVLTVQKVEQVYRKANVTAQMLKHTYITGGVTKLQLIQKQLNEVLRGQLVVENSLGLEAKGAGLFGKNYLNSAEKLSFKYIEDQDTVTYLDRTLYHYGLMTAYYDANLRQDIDRNLIVLERYQPLPAQVNLDLSTDEPQQTSLDLQVSYAQQPSDQVQKVQWLPLQKIIFSHASNALVPLEMKVEIDEQHRIILEVKNTFTGEKQMVYQANALVERFLNQSRHSLTV